WPSSRENPSIHCRPSTPRIPTRATSTSTKTSPSTKSCSPSGSGRPRSCPAGSHEWPSTGVGASGHQALPLHHCPDRACARFRSGVGGVDAVASDVLVVVPVEYVAELHPVTGEGSLSASIDQERTEHVHARSHVGIEGVGVADE